MAAIAIHSQVCGRESTERKPWNSEDWRDLVVFLATACGVICIAAVLYSLGPALGTTLILGGIAVWSLARHPAASKDETAADQDSGYATTANAR